MVGATKDEMMRSLSAMNLQYDEFRVWFPDAGAKRFRITLEVKQPHQLIHLARLVAQIDYDPRHLNAASLWIRAWGMWNPLVEAISLKTFEQLRRSYGENRSLELAPGTYFRHDEFVEAVCCLLQPILVGWDACYVPTWTYGHLDFFVFVSHDSYIEVQARTPEMSERVGKALSSWIDPP